MRPDRALAPSQGTTPTRNRGMRGFLLVAALVGLPAAPLALDDHATPAQIRAEMTRVRRTVNWEDSAAADRATAEIGLLSEQLSRALARGDREARRNGSVDAGGNAAPGSHRDVWNQVVKSATSGPGAPVDLAVNVRLDVERKNREEDSTELKSTRMIAELDTLIIDFSRSEGRILATQLDQYKGIKTLVLTGGGAPTPVALDEVLRRARGLPLETLYVIDFRSAVRSLPAAVADFRGLKVLGLFGNQLEGLPGPVASLPGLTRLYLEANPITTLLPGVLRLTGLTELGVGKTRIGPAERLQIERALPGCQVVE